MIILLDLMPDSEIDVMFISRHLRRYCLFFIRWTPINPQKSTLYDRLLTRSVGLLRILPISTSSHTAGYRSRFRDFLVDASESYDKIPAATQLSVCWA